MLGGNALPKFVTTHLRHNHVRQHHVDTARVVADFEGFGSVAGVASAKGELLAIFDADFVPRPDFLQKVVGRFADPLVGMVQARWEHINASASLLTRCQEMALDGHFVIEQISRSRSGWLFNFNGTAGVWRASCVEDAGGWTQRTLSEDLDLSYRAQLRGWTFVYDADQMALQDMTLLLDDSELSGSVGMQNESLRFDLRVTEINIDRYLPPAAEEETAADDEGSLDEVDLPLEVLRTLDASGNLAFGQAQFAGMTLTDAAFALNARGGRVQLTPSAQLYGGETSGDIVIEVQQDAARATLVQQLRNVDMLPLGRDLLESEMVSGTGSVMLNLTTAGSNVGQMRRDLDGDVSFTVNDGALEGLDASRLAIAGDRIVQGTIEGGPGEDVSARVQFYDHAGEQTSDHEIDPEHRPLPIDGGAVAVVAVAPAAAAPVPTRPASAGAAAPPSPGSCGCAPPWWGRW